MKSHCNFHCGYPLWNLWNLRISTEKSADIHCGICGICGYYPLWIDSTVDIRRFHRISLWISADSTEFLCGYIRRFPRISSVDFDEKQWKPADFMSIKKRRLKKTKIIILRETNGAVFFDIQTIPPLFSSQYNGILIELLTLKISIPRADRHFSIWHCL